MTVSAAAAGVLATAALAAILTRAAREIARRCNVLDVPNQRSSHVTPTPRTGGAALALAAAAGWAALPLIGAPLDHAVAAFMTLTLLSGALGLVDDLYSLSPAPKFIGLAAIAGPALWFMLPVLATSWWMLGAALFWTLGYTNAFNFMDGSDGLAAGTAAIVSWAMAVFASSLGETALAWCALVTGGACAGFLVFNRPPASIFMGDAGSYFLGSGIAAMALLLCANGVSIASMLLLLHPFLCDTSITVIRRVSRGEPFWRAHRQHWYQRLLIAGAAHRDVARGYFTWQAAATLCAFAWEWSGAPGRTAAAAVAAASVAMVIAAVRRAEANAAVRTA